MAFFTTFTYYRQGKPPVIAGTQLAEFVRAFDRLGIASIYGSLAVTLKFGSAIDADDRPAIWVENIGSGIATTREIRWDVAKRCGALSELADSIAGLDEPIHRGHLDLGVAVTEVCNAVQRIGSPENTVDLTLDSWSLEIGPCFTRSLSADDSCLAGWIGLNLSGYGYLYPWTLAELVKRAEREPAIQKLMDLCNQTWPVEASAPRRADIRIRRKMGNLWPYPSLNEPLGWYWGISET